VTSNLSREITRLLKASTDGWYMGIAENIYTPPDEKCTCLFSGLMSAGVPTYDYKT